MYNIVLTRLQHVRSHLRGGSFGGHLGFSDRRVRKTSRADAAHDPVFAIERVARVNPLEEGIVTCGYYFRLGAAELLQSLSSATTSPRMFGILARFSKDPLHGQSGFIPAMRFREVQISIFCRRSKTAPGLSFHAASSNVGTPS